METDIRQTSSKTSAPKEKRPTDKEKPKDKTKSKGKEESKVHKLSLKGSSRLVAEFVRLVPGNLLCATISSAQLLIESFLWLSTVPILDTYDPVRRPTPSKRYQTQDKELIASLQIPTRRLPSRRLYSVRYHSPSPRARLIDTIS